MPICWPWPLTLGAAVSGAMVPVASGAFAGGAPPQPAASGSARASATVNRPRMILGSPPLPSGRRRQRCRLAVRRGRRDDARPPLQELTVDVDELAARVGRVRGVLDVRLHLVVAEVVGEKREPRDGVLN